MKKSGSRSSAPNPNILCIASVKEAPAFMALLLATAKSEYEAPAPSASRTPVRLKWVKPFAPVRQTIPIVVMIVAFNQRRLGTSLLIRYPIIPVSAGADPIAVNVPTATPVERTAEKKEI